MSKVTQRNAIKIGFFERTETKEEKVPSNGFKDLSIRLFSQSLSRIFSQKLLGLNVAKKKPDETFTLLILKKLLQKRRFSIRPLAYSC